MIHKVLDDCKTLKPNRARTANKYLSIKKIMFRHHFATFGNII